MQDDRPARSPDGDPPPRHRHQLKRWLLLELVARRVLRPEILVVVDLVSMATEDAAEVRLARVP